jgi:phosphatidylserine decarboxylase
MLPSRRSWLIARRYAGPPMAAGAGLFAARRRGAAVPVLAAGLMILAFFRDPRRPLDPEPDTAYAAADGFVTLVEENVSAPWMGGPWTRVSTFLSMHNVHVARTPVPGVLDDWQRLDGKCRAALSPHAAEENRQARLRILTADRDDIRVILAAGMIARRITAWVRTGDKLGADGGEMTRLGLIHFGSRADVLLPPGWKPLVKPGMRVRAGITPIARRPAREAARP